MAFTAANALCCNWLLRCVTCPLLQLLCTHHCLASPSLLLMHLAAALPLLLSVYTKCCMPLPCPRASFRKCLRSFYCCALSPLPIPCSTPYTALRWLLRCDQCIAQTAAFYCIMPFALQFCMHCVPFAPFTPYCTMYCMLEWGLDCNVMTLYLWHELERSMLDPETSVRNRLAYRGSMTRLSCTMGTLGKNQRVR